MDDFNLNNVNTHTWMDERHGENQTRLKGAGKGKWNMITQFLKKNFTCNSTDSWAQQWLSNG